MRVWGLRVYDSRVARVRIQHGSRLSMQGLGFGVQVYIKSGLRARDAGCRGFAGLGFRLTGFQFRP